ncbi:MAG: thioredoxin-disulfide reductase [Lachnospiraceae bacterium]|nr:thioredoxin-disulfide reductase [Lachnospiraceae bacterium]
MEEQSKLYDVIIIGSGPAGLSAAIYAQRAKLSTLILEASYISGGQVVNTYEVDNYPGLPGISGMDLGSTLRSHAEKLGAQIVQARVSELQLEGTIKTVVTRKEAYQTKTVLMATGAVHRGLGVPGEQELSGSGVSYCATCDGAFFKDLTVAVVGGGDVAVEDAIFLARTCRKVYVVHRRDALRAARVLQDRLFALPNVEMVWNSTVKEITGEMQVEGITLAGTEAAGERGAKEERKLAVDGCFIAVGIQPNNKLVKDTSLELDESGYIKAGEDGITSIPGVFAAGDVRTKQLRQIITAAADGANCITSIQNYLVTVVSFV